MARAKTPASKQTKRKAKSSTPAWERGNPKGKGQHKPLSSPAKAKAKVRAKRAGRPYPNLVDNMRVAAKARRRKSR